MKKTVRYLSVLMEFTTTVKSGLMARTLVKDQTVIFRFNMIEHLLLNLARKTLSPSKSTIVNLVTLAGIQVQGFTVMLNLFLLRHFI